MTEPLYSTDAERAVLGGLLLSSEAWERVDLEPGDFGAEAHREVFRAITALHAERQPVDALTVAEYLEAQGCGEAVGGLPYVAGLVEDTPSAANIAAHARIVRELALRRRLIDAAGGLTEGARDRSRAVTEVVNEAQRDVLALSLNTQVTGPRLVGEGIGDFLEDTERRGEAEDGIVGMTTGHHDVDRMLLGFEDGDLIVLAGRPSMGKTMLAQQWLRHIAATYGPTLFASLEMPTVQLLRRLAALDARIPLSRLRSGHLEDEDWPRLSQSMTRIRQLPFYVDDTPGITLAELCARTRRLHRQVGLRVLCVDYLQIVNPGEAAGRDARGDQKIAAIATGLKNLAKELGIAVLAIAQLNRSLEQRNDKRPVMSDLRESGQVEQDADVVLFVYRDEVYDAHTATPGIAEIICRKQRNGPIGTARLAFLGSEQRFENLALDDLPEHAPPPMSASGYTGRATGAMDGY